MSLPAPFNRLFQKPGRKNRAGTKCSLHNKSDLTQIFIEDYCLDMSIGIHEWEKQQKQTVSITLYADVINDNTNDSENIDLTVSYSDIVKAITRIANAGHIDLLETLADRIAYMCLSHKRVTKVQVSVGKVDIYKNARKAGVVITRYSSISSACS